MMISDTGIVGEDIIIGEVHGRSPEDEHYIKLAFSHGLSRSIQLGVLENHLAKYLYA